MKKCGFWIIFLVIFALSAQTAAEAAGPLTDGRYTIEVTLSGGSGRAYVESPAELKVNGGAATAVVEWSSPYYEYMLINETYYYPVSTEGNSTFEIPASIDEDMEVIAQTVAMSEPHEIDYVLRFDSATLKPFDGGGAVLSPFGTVAAIIIVLSVAVLLTTIWMRRAKGRKTTKKERNL